MTGAPVEAGAEKGMPVQSRYCKRSPGNYVTDASWEGAEGDEAKPGDLPVTKLGAYGR